MMIQSIYKNGLILAGFALFSIGLIAVFALLTADKIELEKQKKLISELQQVIDSSRYNNDILDECIFIDSNGVLAAQKVRVFRMTQNDRPVALVFNTIASNGYGGNIELLVGVDHQLTLTGVRVIQHQETPGLGDKIDTRNGSWITQFSGLSLTQPNAEKWSVTKDGGVFDGFTGATITPRAIVNRIKTALEYIGENSEQLFAQPNQCGTGHE